MASNRSRASVATAVALAMLPWQSVVAASLTCESDGYYRRCQTDTREGVRLSRELGQVKCVQGDSWGYDDGAVWVDRGCKAEFTLGTAADGTGPRAMPPAPADTGSSRADAPPAEGGGQGIDTTTAVIGAVGVAAALGAAAALLGKNNDKDDHGDNRKRRNNVAAAREQCRDEARRSGYRDIEITDAERDRREVQIDLKMRRDGRNVRAVCDYDARSKRARIYTTSR